ncbi:MAG: hypothetical protein HY959_02740 [Ignavibacteriae bacterium]|nr:hypothetical protein [Ignavibacteriota bacterium]
MKNLEQIKTFIRLRSSGHSLRETAKILDKSVNTMTNWNKKYCSVVFEVQSEELKEFKKKLLEEKKARLENLNSHFSKILGKLDDSEILLRYDKMMTLLIKLSKSIDACQSSIVLSEISNCADELKPDEFEIDKPNKEIGTPNQKIGTKTTKNRSKNIEIEQKTK